MLQPPKSPPPSSESKCSEPSVKKQKVNEEEDAEGEKPQLPSSPPPSEGKNESESDSSESDADEESSDFKTLDPLPIDGSHIKCHHFLPHKDVGYFPNPGDIECWNKYVDQIQESEGFDIKDYPSSVPFRSITLMWYYLEDLENVKLMKGYAAQALEQYNHKHGTTYEVNEIIRVNEDGCRDVTYYITLSVKNGESEYFQVKVVDRLHKSLKVLIVRPRLWMMLNVQRNAKALLSMRKMDVLNIYSKELPDMNYAANTGKESQFLEKCLLNGKYCTLVLKTKEGIEPGEVIAAITYQIILADTQFAEVPLAAVKSVYQHKGFSVIGQVDTKGRARRLPIKADIRKALCFPGGSNLMISHFNKDNLHGSAVYLNLKFPLKPSLEDCRSPMCQEQRDTLSEGDNLSQSRNQATKTADSNYYDWQDFQPGDEAIGSSMHVRIGFNERESQALLKKCSCSASGSKKRTWETSSTSVKSKKIKGGHQTHCDLHAKDTSLESVTRTCFSAVSKSKCPVDITPNDHLTSQFLEKNAEGATAVNLTYEEHTSRGISSRGTNFSIMLMNVADDNKKANLTKIIGDLGGDVTSDGSLSTHVVTGKVRKTLNFCSALCSAAWILSPSWLKESFRNGKFIDEMPSISRDEDYELKYRSSEAQLGVQLLSRYSRICRLDLILVIGGLDQVKDESKTIFIACEEDMDEALSAVKKGKYGLSAVTGL
ncbi:hypothetical protein CQW23_09039 [Capsicum baccatum]|uniref:BRCT domain-containing protein n=1 Tax=Capsicum baccatum TaxID=33114 RepID=A0A2G2XAR7_CAPBA|nr:hypothetical protein CQW23_09039 [Capsicum baccatum]